MVRFALLCCVDVLPTAQHSSSEQAPILGKRKIKRVEDPEVAERRRLKKLRLQKQAALSQFHVLPQFDHVELKLMRIAKRGVVTLFNTVNTQQRERKQWMEEAQEVRLRAQLVFPAIAWLPAGLCLCLWLNCSSPVSSSTSSLDSAPHSLVARSSRLMSSVERRRICGRNWMFAGRPRAPTALDQQARATRRSPIQPPFSSAMIS